MPDAWPCASQASSTAGRIPERYISTCSQHSSRLVEPLIYPTHAAVSGARGADCSWHITSGLAVVHQAPCHNVMCLFALLLRSRGPLALMLGLMCSLVVPVFAGYNHW